MRGLVVSIGIAGVLAGRALAAEAPSGTPVAPAKPPVTGCSVFEPVAVNKLPKADQPKLPVVTEELAKRVPDWKTAAAAAADAEIAIDSVDPMSGRRTTVLAQRVGGAWLASAVQDGGRARDNATAAAVTKQATLDPGQGAVMDQALSDPCFWSTPPILPNDLPAKSGGTFVCYDGMNTAFRVRVGSKLWFGDQRCRVVGSPAKIGTILWKATLPPSFSGRYVNYMPPR